MQNPSVVDPHIEDKKRILHLMNDLGIQAADIGLPGAGPRAVEDVIALAQEIVSAKLAIRPNCAARTHKNDITPIIEISNKVGIPIEACTFLGSSPIRQYVEDWDIDRMLRLTEEAVDFAVKGGLPVMMVTEDTTRAHPEDLRRIYTIAINYGAKRICLADTVGHVTPYGVKHLMRFIKEMLREIGAQDVKVDWHGHRDRGLAVINSLVAIEEGADRIHGTAFGIGERCGNAPMEVLLVNCKLMGYIEQDLAKLNEYCRFVSRVCYLPIAPNYMIVGRDAFRTATGVHAAAIIKAEKKGHAWLADRVYSGVPASLVGRDQVIEIGPMSGESNVIYWLTKRGIEPTRELVEKIFRAAKQAHRVFTDEEILELIHGEPAYGMAFDGH
ncbi:MAG: 2-isopropylmalate synthase [candidate division NC10 bacterium RIFCSPLOWO2_12_FULL_66_18]|nr:MAG: 2-isopropylmalate synthase [candidate division NC10 bacterium RIFCSPLOWO2_02_FULL_66_22]OGB96826.1 MAG: 2-isopropylmalate synthase [candidate division NC10 bacterium RIFCSPLOWO2_12_FULL_66_18]